MKTTHEQDTTKAADLNWQVFVTPGIPIVTPDRPPGVSETYFQAMASTLIYGIRDAVLVDAFMTTEQANALADWVASKGKNLTTIYITHGHGDHWFGVGALLERFPNARVVATPDTTCLHVPSIGLVVAGDAAYNDVHLYLVESNAKNRQEWIAALDKFESLKSHSQSGSR
jgi:glyoxylase-like metal-dependent hydrolase (beta-lactamase superfamily II)